MGVDEIKSQGFSLKELFRDVAYQVDYYQRDYTWGEEEVRTLLRDLCTSFSHWSNDPALIRRPGNAPQYFLGPFVYYEQSKNRRCLVDGQQRFVTLHLLFLQLRARVRDHGDARRVDRLNRAITTDGAHFSIGISDHEPVLRAIDEGRVYETGLGDSLSRRNLWVRSQQIEAQLAEELDADKLDRFTDWLLDRVVLVGIRAANQDHGYRMFETMNDRGARLTAVDLLKSHLLANVGTGEDQMNTRWQRCCGSWPPTVETLARPHVSSRRRCWPATRAPTMPRTASRSTPTSTCGCGRTQSTWGWFPIAPRTSWTSCRACWRRPGSSCLSSPRAAH
ncbi:DUF262 domain-containing protein [Streptomyces sp. NPDC001520]|uniref:DUF262 domain-containing protein n=1 Tax=Streptomyces sp. NPDC001520 TaxID=3364581 RepID=UPI0036961702